MTNVIRILNVLYAGFSVKIDGYDYYLGKNNMLGIKTDRYIDGIKQPDDGTIQGVDWSLQSFLTACEQMSEQEVNTQCAEAEQQIGLAVVKSDTEKIDKSYNIGNEERKYKIKSNRYLFDYPKFLGGLIEGLGHMMQNSGAIPLSELRYWLNNITKYIYKMLDYAENVVYYVKYGKEPTIDPDAPQLSDEPVDAFYLNDDDIPF